MGENQVMVDPAATAAADERRGLSRRGLLARGAAGGVALAGSGLIGSAAAFASGSAGVTPAKDIFAIAQIAEQLAVTFYRNGVKHARRLGLRGDELDYVKAAGIEEQIHHQLFASLTGKPVQPVTHFSFPHGDDTFEHLELFVATQQQLEGVFDSAFLSAIRELSMQGLHRPAQIAGQIACIESEHRVLGRDIAAGHGIKTLPNPAGSGGRVPTDPADNWGFAPVLVAKVADAPALIKKAGYLSPHGHGPEANDFEYVPINMHSGTYRAVADRIMYKQPFAVGQS